MKLQCYVTSAASLNGDALLVCAKGRELSASEYAEAEPLEFRVRDTTQNRRTFYVGREFTLSIEAK